MDGSPLTQLLDKARQAKQAGDALKETARQVAIAAGQNRPKPPDRETDAQGTVGK